MSAATLKSEIKEFVVYVIDNCEEIYAGYSRALMTALTKEDKEDSERHYIFKVCSEIGEKLGLTVYCRSDMHYNAVKIAIDTGLSIKKGQECA